MTDQFAAGASALGYLYQLRYALLRGLNAAEDVSVYLEQLDDLVLEDKGTSAELLSLKHHTTAANLTDTCADLWKTLRIWATRLSESAITPAQTLLTLVTTGTAPADSAASLLRPEDRDPEGALKLLEAAARESTNAALRSSFDAFLGLSHSQRLVLLEMVEIIDQAPDIIDVTEETTATLAHAVRREHRALLVERLEGWWFDKCVRILRGRGTKCVPVYEIQDQVRGIAEQFNPDALPIDFSDSVPPSGEDPASDTRRFVVQLRLIGVNSSRIEKAIIDYYRAFEQRSRWAREELLVGDEVERYERKLIDEWERYRLALLDDVDEVTAEEVLQKIGRMIFNWMEMTADIRIRSNVTEDYVRRGSYHLLADRTPARVGWHPFFADRLAALIVGGGK